MNSTIRQVIVWVVIIGGAILLYSVFHNSGGKQPEEVNYSRLVAMTSNGEIKSAKIEPGKVTGELQNNRGRFTSSIYGEFVARDLAELMSKNKVDVTMDQSSGGGIWVTVLATYAPFLFIIAFWIFMVRQMQSGGNKALSFGKSRAKLLSNQQKRVTFKDVAGVEEAKEELQEIIEFLKEPQKFQKLGGRIPKGVLMMGPPGTGKTLLARAIAGEANVPFFSISGSDFVEMFVGVGASRVRDLFEQGKAHAPCIIFIDEIDAVGRHRGAGLGGGHDEREQTLNQLLVEMDGFESNDGVILLAATNRPDILDPALLRPGRFDRQIVVDMPDLKGREQILRVHTRKIPLASNVNLEPIAKGTPGLAGAELANIVNEAALLAARRNKAQVDQPDLEDAKDKVMLGAERKSLVMKEEERRLTAYHEAGHAVCAMVVKGNDPLHKVTIVPRGRALGVAFTLPEDDRVSVTREQIEARIVMAYGGRVSEEMIFGHDRVTTGAASDIQQATALARRYVTQWGLSDEIGPILVGDQEHEVFLGRELVNRREVSEKTAQLVDAEVKKVIDNSYKRAKAALTENLELLHKVAAALLERETLTRDDIELMRKGLPLPPRLPSTPLPPSPATPPHSASPAPKPSAPPLLGEPGISPV